MEKTLSHEGLCQFQGEGGQVWLYRSLHGGSTVRNTKRSEGHSTENALSHSCFLVKAAKVFCAFKNDFTVSVKDTLWCRRQIGNEDNAKILLKNGYRNRNKKPRRQNEENMLTDSSFQESVESQR